MLYGMHTLWCVHQVVMLTHFPAHSFVIMPSKQLRNSTRPGYAATPQQRQAVAVQVQLCLLPFSRMNRSVQPNISNTMKQPIKRINPAASSDYHIPWLSVEISTHTWAAWLCDLPLQCALHVLCACVPTHPHLCTASPPHSMPISHTHTYTHALSDLVRHPLGQRTHGLSPIAAMQHFRPH